MDFFGHQNAARARTRKLVVMLGLSLLLLAAALYAVLVPILGTWLSSYRINPPFDGPQLVLWDPITFLWVLGGVTVFVGAAALYKSSSLSRGGSAVALSLGGRELSSSSIDPLERRLLNVVEEMAIASGITMPAVYVLDHETGINAFAAGLSPNEAAIGVTRGTLEQLSRDELQGVIAHEYSHILNGDMRLNLRLVALVYGLVFFSMVGSTIVRTVRAPRRSRNSDNRGLAIVFAVGAAMWILGSLGVLCSRVMKGAISRQREFLADAAAVQFTRNPDGIASALKRILLGAAGDTLETPRKEEVSHFLFSNGTNGFFAGLFATHPPLPSRIARIDPSFSADSATLERYRSSGVDEASRIDDGEVATLNRGSQGLASTDVATMIGTVSSSSVSRAHTVIESFPPVLKEMVRDASRAGDTVLALLLDSDSELRLAQLKYLETQDRLEGVTQAYEVVKHIEPTLRLPLVQLAMGALGQISLPEAKRYIMTLKALAESDRTVSIYEFSLLTIVRITLQRRHEIVPAPAERFDAPSQIAHSLGVLVTRLVDVSAKDETERARLFRIAVEGWSVSRVSADAANLNALGKALIELRDTAPDLKREIIRRIAQVIVSDQRVSLDEAYLLRAICTVLEAPLPIAA
jgi:Zn-dependent protease with chaperone function